MCLGGQQFSLDKLLDCERGFTAAMLMLYTEAQQLCLKVNRVYLCGLTVTNSQNVKQRLAMY